MASGHSTSAAATAAYTINLPAAATPTFSLAAGTYTTAQTVTIADATAGATIYYTTNGTTPTTSSPVYAGAIAISSSETVAAIAVAPGYSTSAVASATYTLEAMPTFLSLTSSANPSNVSQYVTFYALVTTEDVLGVPIGSVQFSDNGVAMGSPVPLQRLLRRLHNRRAFRRQQQYHCDLHPHQRFRVHRQHIDAGAVCRWRLRGHNCH